MSRFIYAFVNGARSCRACRIAVQFGSWGLADLNDAPHAPPCMHREKRRQQDYEKSGERGRVGEVVCKSLEKIVTNLLGFEVQDMQYPHFL